VNLLFENIIDHLKVIKQTLLFDKYCFYRLTMPAFPLVCNKSSVRFFVTTSTNQLWSMDFAPYQASNVRCLSVLSLAIDFSIGMIAQRVSVSIRG
jgi:hypothetical protein